MKSKQPKTKNIYKRNVFKSGIQCEECMIWRDDLFTVGTLLQCGRLYRSDIVREGTFVMLEAEDPGSVSLT